jgi:DNA-binding HxlR family transcriptional regulator
MDVPDSKACAASAEKAALVREILGRIADKWTLIVIDALDGEEAMRFSRLRERVAGVSQRMLTKTLRQLERDGLVARRVFPAVPPHVEYRLTPLGESLGNAVCAIWLWAAENADEVTAARSAYDARTG